MKNKLNDTNKFKFYLVQAMGLIALTLFYVNCSPISNSFLSSSSENFSKKEYSHQMVSANPISLSSNLSAIDIFSINTPFKIVDSSNSGFSYAYGPAIISVDGTYYAYYCSSGKGSFDWDHIRMSTSQDLMNWSSPVDILTSTKVERANCDPSIVQYDAGDGLYFYLMYSGNAVNVQTLNFIARSKSPTGPFLKYTDRGTWENQPKDSHAVIWPGVRGYDDKSGAYGAGQPSLVVYNGKVYQWYTDTTVENVARIYFTSSTDMINWTPAVVTNVYSASIDVKFDDLTKQFVMFRMIDEHQINSAMIVMTSLDGVQWTNAKTLCDANCFPDWANNIGVSGDRYGHLIPGQMLVAYGAPYDLSSTYNNNCSISGKRNCWGYWDLFGQMLSLDIPVLRPDHDINSISLNCQFPLQTGAREQCLVTEKNIKSRDWFVNNQLITQCHNQTSCTWDSVPAGSYDVQVKGLDILNKNVESSVVHVEVNSAPSYSMNIKCEAANKAGGNASCTAQYSGNLASGDWFVNGQPVKECHNQPTCAWQNVPEGQYIVYARGYDSHGTLVVSSNIVVANIAK